MTLIDEIKARKKMILITVLVMTILIIILFILPVFYQGTTQGVLLYDPI